ncbi:MAG: hypothetical protein ACJA1C_001596 [Crocinitomicaceae bacterium]|jgi:hypothetical protein
MKNRIQLLLALLSMVIVQNVSAQWNQIGSDILGQGVNDVFGRSLSMSGDGLTIAVGAGLSSGGGLAGSVRVYKNLGGAWTQLGIDISGNTNGENTGSSVSLSNDGLTVAIGAPGSNANIGHVQVYKYFAGAWNQLGSNIDGINTNGWSGRSVSISDDGLTLAIGAPWSIGSGGYEGLVRIYTFNGSTWTQEGSDILGEASNDQSGESVSISGDGLTLAIGAIGNDDNGADAGQVRVYTNIASTWTQIGGDINGESAGDFAGKALSLSADGSTVAIGASQNGGAGLNAGHVRVYKNIGGAWLQQGSDIDGDAVDDYSGKSVSISDNGSIVAIGATGSDVNGSNSGHVRVLKLISGTWTQQGGDLNGENAGDAGGQAVALNGDGTIVANGIYDYGVNVGKVKIYKTCTSATIDTQTACGTYTWIDGNVYTTSNNTATHTLSNTSGCDSTITLDLTVNPMPDAATTVSLETITATQAGASYIWVDCDNGNIPIPNETSQSFTPTVTGNYAVRIVLNGCTVTSECVAITIVGIDENEFDASFLIYPNPTKSILNIDPEVNIETIVIVDVMGKTIKTIVTPNNTIDVSFLTKGIYFLQIQTDTILKSRKFIKE